MSLYRNDFPFAEKSNMCRWFLHLMVVHVQVAGKASQEIEQNAAEAGSRLQQALEHVASLTERVHVCETF